jgi:hypothetical protein
MTESTKIEFRYRKISQLEDITDLVEMLFSGNRNQQHAGARILMALKPGDDLVESLSFLEDRHGISRRTLQRARAKLSRLGLIEHVTWMNRNYHGRQGWKLSSRMGTALRQLADKIDDWRKDDRPERREKDEMLVGLLG